MRDNQSFNEYVEKLTNLAAVEINKRDVNNLTDEYLDDIFQFTLNKLAKSRNELSVSDDFLYQTIKDKVS